MKGSMLYPLKDRLLATELKLKRLFQKKEEVTGKLELRRGCVKEQLEAEREIVKYHMQSQQVEELVSAGEEIPLYLSRASSASSLDDFLLALPDATLAKLDEVGWLQSSW